MDDIIGDSELDYSYSGSYGDPTKLFDYDFSNLFDSFGGVDLSNLDVVRQFTGGADDANRVTSYIDQLVGGLANPTNDEELAAAISQFTGGDADAARITDYIDTLTENQVLQNIIGDTGLTWDEALNAGGYKADIPLGGSADAIKNYAGITGDKTVLDDKTDTKIIRDVFNTITGDKNNLALLAALLGGLLGLTTAPKTTSGAKGYVAGTGTKPLTATRTALPTTGAPGAGGKRFMSDVVYAAEGGLMDIISGQPNQNVTFMAAGGMPSMAEYLAGTKGLRLGDNRNYDRLIGSGYSVSDTLKTLPQVADKELASGGLSSLGGYSDGGRMLKGPGDGMSDSIPATIEGKRPARLANDEFVVPADVVSHLGNGSSDAGAKVLYDMMAKVRKARTGNSKQGKQINPKKFTPV